MRGAEGGMVGRIVQQIRLAVGVLACRRSCPATTNASDPEPSTNVEQLGAQRLLCTHSLCPFRPLTAVAR